MPACPDILRDGAETSERLRAIAVEVHELGSGFDDEREKVRAAGVNLVNRAVAIGDLLNEAFDLCGHGEWENWCRTNVSFDRRTAQKYRKLANANHDSHLLADCDSLRHAYQLCGIIPSEGEDTGDGKEKKEKGKESKPPLMKVIDLLTKANDMLSEHPEIVKSREYQAALFWLCRASGMSREFLLSAMPTDLPVPSLPTDHLPVPRLPKLKPVEHPMEEAGQAEPPPGPRKPNLKPAPSWPKLPTEYPRPTGPPRLKPAKKAEEAGQDDPPPGPRKPNLKPSGWVKPVQH